MPCQPPPPLSHDTKLQALVYDILPSTTAIIYYAIGLKKEKEKKAASGQFFVGAQITVSTEYVANNSKYIRRHKECPFSGEPTLAEFGGMCKEAMLRSVETYLPTLFHGECTRLRLPSSALLKCLCHCTLCSATARPCGP